MSDVYTRETRYAHTLRLLDGKRTLLVGRLGGRGGAAASDDAALIRCTGGRPGPLPGEGADETGLGGCTLLFVRCIGKGRALLARRCVGVDNTFLLALKRLFSLASRFALSSIPFPVFVFVREPEPNKRCELSGSREKIVGLGAVLFLIGLMTFSTYVILFACFSSIFPLSTAINC